MEVWVFLGDTMNLDMPTYKEQVNKVLEDYSFKLSNHLEDGSDFRIFYKNGGDTISVLTVINKEDDPSVLNRIYSTEAQIINTHVLKVEDGALNLNFRVVPNYTTLSAIVPEGFKRFNAK